MTSAHKSPRAWWVATRASIDAGNCVAISRDVRLPKGRLTFRAEATNAFNVVNYGQPGASVPSGTTSTTFGVIRSARAMRQVQLGVRWTF